MQSNKKKKSVRRVQDHQLVYYQDKYDQKKTKTYSQIHQEQVKYESKNQMEGLLNFHPSRNGKNGGSIYSFNSKSKSGRSASFYNKSQAGKGRESIHLEMVSLPLG